MIQSRQLAAIMFTDIVGYTALMGNNEQRAFELLRKNREIQKPVIEEFGGQWIKELPGKAVEGVKEGGRMLGRAAKAGWEFMKKHKILTAVTVGTLLVIGAWQLGLLPGWPEAAHHPRTPGHAARRRRFRRAGGSRPGA